jgi:cytochrome P450
MSSRIPVGGGWLAAPQNTLQLIRNPLALMRELRARHGQTFRMRLLDGDSVVTGDPWFIGEVFGATESFDAPNDIVEPLVGSGSIVLANGSRHKRKRKLMAPPLHGQRMKAYGEIIVAATERSLAPLRPGEVIDILSITQQISLEIILRAVFGVTDPRRVEQLRGTIGDAIDGLPAWLFFASALQRPFGGFGPWARYQRRVAALRESLFAEISTARAAGAEPREDILALLLAARDEQGEAMDDTELFDELRTLVIAGHETTATTLAWAVWELHRNPGVLRSLHEALVHDGAAPGIEQLAALPYLRATCDEALRMHPIVPLFRRRPTADVEVAGHAIPGGTVISPCVLLTHYDEAIFEAPDAFRPERFVDRKYSTSEFMPFGGGNRRCLGAAFAQYELQLALGTLIANHRFSLASEAPLKLVMNGITTRPDRGVWLRYEGRA